MLRAFLRFFNLQNVRLRLRVRSLESALEAERTRLTAEIERNRLRESQLIERILEASSLRPLPAQHFIPAKEKPSQKVLTPMQQEDREEWAEMAESAGFPRHKGYADWDKLHGFE